MSAGDATAAAAAAAAGVANARPNPAAAVADAAGPSAPSGVAEHGKRVDQDGAGDDAAMDVEEIVHRGNQAWTVRSQKPVTLCVGQVNMHSKSQALCWPAQHEMRKTPSQAFDCIAGSAAVMLSRTC